VTTPNPACTVNGSSPPKAVSATSSVTIALGAPAGATFWFLTCVSTDDSTTPAAVNATLAVTLGTHSATFTSLGQGTAYIFQSTVGVGLGSAQGAGLDANFQVQPMYTTTFKVYVLANNSLIVIAYNEEVEQDPVNGWVVELNAMIRTFSGGGVTWANDLAGSSGTHQYVAAISGSGGTGGTVSLGTGTAGLTLQGTTSTGATSPTTTLQGSAALTGGHNGGDLDLYSGAGSGSNRPGTVNIDVGGATGTPSINIGVGVTGVGTVITVGHNSTYSSTNIVGSFNVGNTSNANAINLSTSGNLVLATVGSATWTSTGGLALQAAGSLVLGWQNNVSSSGTFVWVQAGNAGSGANGVTVAGSDSNSGNQSGGTVTVRGGTGLGTGVGGNWAGTGGTGGNAAGAAGTWTAAGGTGGAGAAGNNTGAAGGAASLTGGAGGASTGSAANANGANLTLDGGPAGTGGGGTAGVAGAVLLGTASQSTTIGQSGKTTTINGTVSFGTSPIAWASQISSASAATTLSITSANFTVETLTTGTMSVLSAGALTFTGAAASTWSTSAGALTVDSAAALDLGSGTATSVIIGNVANTATIAMATKTAAAGAWTVAVAGTTMLTVGGVAGDNLTIGTATGGCVYGTHLITYGAIAAAVVITQTAQITDAAVHNMTVAAQSANSAATNFTQGAVLLLQSGAPSGSAWTNGASGAVRIQPGGLAANTLVDCCDLGTTLNTSRRVVGLCGLGATGSANVPTGDGVCWIGNASTNPSSNGSSGVTVWSQSAQLWCSKGFGVSNANATAFDVNATSAATVTIGAAVALAWAGTGSVTGSLVSGGAFTITAGAASTWKSAVGALTVDSAAALNLGSSTATSVVLGNTANTTVITCNAGLGGTTGGLLLNTQTTSAASGSVAITAGVTRVVCTGGALSNNLTLALPNVVGTWFINVDGITLNSHNLIISCGTATATFTALFVASKSMIVVDSAGGNTIAICAPGTWT
jgi:hypothetical protein